MKHRVFGAALVVMAGIAASSAPVHAEYRQGMYFSFGIGGAVVMGGERGVGLTNPCPGVSPLARPLWYQPGNNFCEVAGSQDRYDEMVRTDWGSGMGVQVRLGYNILGYASLEAALSGHGLPTGEEGAGHVQIQVRWHPMQLWMPLEERDYDFDVFGGVGVYSLGGYHPDPNVQGNDDGKGFGGGLHSSFGAAFNYQVAESVQIGVDLKFVMPIYDEWVANFDKDYRTEISDPAGPIVFIPTAQVNFNLF